MPIVTTPGYQSNDEPDHRHRRLYQVGVGLALLAAGILCFVIGT